MPGRAVVNLDDVNLHDWIDEACDALDLDIEVDEGLVLDLARVAAHNVQRPAAPITAYLLGVAIGSRGAQAEEAEQLAARLSELAEAWDRPNGPAEIPEPVEAEELEDIDA